MRYSKLFIILSLLAVLSASCKKDHYDVGNVHGVNAEGEVLLPLAHKTSTIMELMERFNIDSIISCTDEGNLYYNVSYEFPTVVKGSDFMKFDDLNYDEHYAFPNPFLSEIPDVFDTVVSFELPLQFESDYLGVIEAWMRSGRFDFEVSTNIGILQRIVLRSPDIKDADGNDMMLDFAFCNESFGFDLDGLRYETQEANHITLGFDIYFSVIWCDDPELYVDLSVKGHDFVIKEMMGTVHTMAFSSVIDTAFNVFPSNLSGQLDIKDARLHISTRNFFGITTRLEVDTALVYADEIEPYSIVDPLPLYVTIPTCMTMTEIFNQRFDATIQAHGGRVRTACFLLLNPYASSEIVSVADTCVLDAQLGVDIPFAFRASDVQYTDTVEMSMNEIEMPEMIESVTLDLDITSNLPLNFNGWFYLYDSQTGMITDTLNADGKLIEASFNGLPATTTVSLEITGARLDNLLHSDHIIMQYEVDTDAHDVKLNAQQELSLSAKAKIKYNGVINFDKE